MSFTDVDQEGARPFAIVNGGKADGQIIYILEKHNTGLKSKPWRHIEYNKGEFELYPDPDNIRVIYVAGPAGSGKSTYCAQYIAKMRNIYPDSQFILFSRLNEDRVLDELDPERVVIDETLIEDPIEYDDIPANSIILFDDIDCVSDKDLQKRVYKIKDQLLELGRHKHITVLVTSHLINGNDKATTRTMLNESQAVVFFPSGSSAYGINFFAKKYLGFSTKQIDTMMGYETRWITVLTKFPQIIMTEHTAIFAKDIGKKDKF